MHNHFLAMLFVLFCFMIPLAAAVTKCYNVDMEEMVCSAHLSEFCLKLECEKADFRGCGSGVLNEKTGSILCGKFGIGALKPGGAHSCDSDKCNGGTGHVSSNNAIVVVAIGAIVAMLVTKLEWII